MRFNSIGVMAALALALALLALSGCASLHDGKGFEHQPGEPSIEHRH